MRNWKSLLKNDPTNWLLENEKQEKRICEFLMYIALLRFPVLALRDRGFT